MGVGNDLKDLIKTISSVIKSNLNVKFLYLITHPPNPSFSAKSESSTDSDNSDEECDSNKIRDSVFNRINETKML